MRISVFGTDIETLLGQDDWKKYSSPQKIIGYLLNYQIITANFKFISLNGVKEETLFALSRNFGVTGPHSYTQSACLSTRAALQPLHEELDAHSSELDAPAIVNVSTTAPAEAVVRRKVAAKIAPDQLQKSGIIVEQYEHLVKAGEIERDMYQMKVVNALQELNDRLVSYAPPKDSFLSKVNFSNRINQLCGLFEIDRIPSSLPLNPRSLVAVPIQRNQRACIYLEQLDAEKQCSWIFSMNIATSMKSARNVFIFIHSCWMSILVSSQLYRS